ETSIGGQANALPETLWTQISEAGTRDPERARAALSRLIERYWKPVYFFVRRRGASVEDSKDLTQGFFADLLERCAITRVDPARGRFRSWLLACLRHYLSDESDRARATKRGGLAQTLPLDGAESEYRDDATSPEEAFHRAWATDLLREAIASLDERRRALLEARARGEPADPRRVFEARAALKQALLARLRDTVGSAREAEEELRDLQRDFS
ncbi:MAG: sigma-70 family RNA polymerase sigma factor, partial [Planctomycetes bacterium]|nr:sigma-70 family RNA polymerase sigma factor [Planctomycetota bacterium]